MAEFAREPLTMEEHAEVAERLTEMAAWFQDLARQLKKRYGDNVFSSATQAEQCARSLLSFGRLYMRREWMQDMEDNPSGQPCPYPDLTDKEKKRLGVK